MYRLGPRFACRRILHVVVDFVCVLFCQFEDEALPPTEATERQLHSIGRAMKGYLYLFHRNANNKGHKQVVICSVQSTFLPKEMLFIFCPAHVERENKRRG